MVVIQKGMYATERSHKIRAENYAYLTMHTLITAPPKARLY
jgi:hypothetical protein